MESKMDPTIPLNLDKLAAYATDSLRKYLIEMAEKNLKKLVSSNPSLPGKETYEEVIAFGLLPKEPKAETDSPREYKNFRFSNNYLTSDNLENLPEDLSKFFTTIESVKEEIKHLCETSEEIYTRELPTVEVQADFDKELPFLKLFVRLSGRIA